jgi:hypothetical protein
MTESTQADAMAQKFEEDNEIASVRSHQQT